MVDKYYKLEAENVTRKHIQLVSELLGDCAKKLIDRGAKHDQSKFSDIELEPLSKMQELIAKKGHAPYGSVEYWKRSEILKPMLQHHYENNSHHPEHHRDGIDGMTIFDLIEMLMDWRAASIRGEENAINVSASTAKYNISPQLGKIIENTYNDLCWKFK